MASLAFRFEEITARELKPELYELDGISRATMFTTERQAVAPTFYACAQSFVKFLVARVGLQAMVELFPLIREGKVDERLAQLTQSSLPLLRAEWLRTIGYVAAIDTDAH